MPKISPVRIFRLWHRLKAKIKCRQCKHNRPTFRDFCLADAIKIEGKDIRDIDGNLVFRTVDMYRLVNEKDILNKNGNCIHYKRMD